MAINKPLVHIKDWHIVTAFTPRRLYGWPIDHPGFPLVTNIKGVITSPIIAEYVAGPEHQHYIETENTIYVLVGENPAHPPPECGDCASRQLAGDAAG